GGAILGHRLLFLGDLQRFDRDGDAPAALIDIGDGGIDLVADIEALWALLGAIARQVGAFDKGGDIGIRELDLDAAILHRQHLAGDLAALAQLADALHRIAAHLLDAETDALLLAVDVEHHRFYDVALLVVLDRLVSRPVPVEVREMHHAVDATIKADE